MSQKVLSADIALKLDVGTLRRGWLDTPQLSDESLLPPLELKEAYTARIEALSIERKEIYKALGCPGKAGIKKLKGREFVHEKPLLLAKYFHLGDEIKRLMDGLSEIKKNTMGPRKKGGQPAQNLPEAFFLVATNSLDRATVEDLVKKAKTALNSEFSGNQEDWAEFVRSL
ncbi:TPA: hypothetical protein ACF37B_004405 [Vibrio parahaemolyticus]